MTASSAWSDNEEKFGAQRARLNLDRWPQGWTAHVEDRFPWLQVNLNDPFIVTRIATQGYGGTIDQWVKKYRMSWKNEQGDWRNYSVPHRVSSSAIHWKTKVIISYISIFKGALYRHAILVITLNALFSLDCFVRNEIKHQPCKSATGCHYQSSGLVVFRRTIFAALKLFTVIFCYHRQGWKWIGKIARPLPFLQGHF